MTDLNEKRKEKLQTIIMSDGGLFQLTQYEVTTFHALMILPDGYLGDIAYKMCSNRINDCFYKDELVKLIILQLRKCSELLVGHTLPADYNKIDQI